jgi:GT2 family glycosyltransferase
MDDFPAGPASRGPRRPPLSVVIPVYNGGQHFERCLRGLRDSAWTDYQLIVIDDGSTDGSAALAERFGATVARHESPHGPAAARNAGALLADAPIVFFVDADVAVHPETIGRIMAHFANNPSLGALFGSYDDQPTAPGVVSQYRNLLHHFVHQQGEFAGELRPANTFWTGCGAIRRELFRDLGGFDPQLYRRPAIEDIELGFRIVRAGQRVMLARDVQATHLKRWTLRQVLRTDVFQRGVPWMLLLMRSKVDQRDLNVSNGQRLCVLTTGLGWLGLSISPFWPIALSVFALNLATIAACNLRFYRFLTRSRGIGFALASFPLHYLYFCCCGISVVIAHAIQARSRWELTRAVSAGSRGHAAEPSPAAPKSLGKRSRWSVRSRSR